MLMRKVMIGVLSMMFFMPVSADQSVAGDAPGWRGTSLEMLLGRWKIDAVFYDPQGVPHEEKARYVVKPDRQLRPGNDWLVGIYTGRRTDGSPAHNLRFHHRVDPVTGAMTLLQFGDVGEDELVIVRSGMDDGAGTVTWTGVLSGTTIPFVEIWRIEPDRFTFEAFTPDVNGVRIAYGEAIRVGGRRHH